VVNGYRLCRLLLASDNAHAYHSFLLTRSSSRRWSYKFHCVIFVITLDMLAHDSIRKEQ
jgi:hypothetical protein